MAKELAAEALRRVCDPQGLDFETSASLQDLGEVLGQPRAVAALELGASIASHGFNLFALGEPGSGKTTLIRQNLQQRAGSQTPPSDLCYVHNFSDSRRPIPLRLTPGLGRRFKRDMDNLVEDLRRELPRAFDAPEYTGRRDKIAEELDDQRRQELVRMEQQASGSGFQLLKGPGALVLAPSVGGKPLDEDALAQLSTEDREKIAQVRDRLQHEIEEHLRTIRAVEKKARESLHELDKQTATFATRHLIGELRARYREQPAVLEYLEAWQADVIAHNEDFRKTKEEAAPILPFAPPPGGDRPFVRYQVNVLVDNADLKGAPVILESNPTFHNLTGRIEHQSTWGGVFTDHTMIKAGALHRANGGYLILPARECLMNAFAWDGLKRALKDRALRIEELGAQLSLVSTVTLDPDPVPLDVKVVLIGGPALYFLLYAYDEDFQKLFKVKADFTTRMPRNAESERGYALFVSTIARQEQTLPFDRGAVARMIEYGARAADDQEHLSTRFGEIADLVREAAHRAAQNTHKTVTADDVRSAEDARRYRRSLVQERLRESLLEGTVLLEATGVATGRINGLTVLSIGDYSFGQPARLTATVGPGRGGVLSIEREVELSGPIHGKGVLILSGYLLRKYGRSGPLSLSASLVFEQSYGMVEGDSASMAELCVLLSATAETPLRQDIAVTGSINQHGQVQAIGGVNEKIEGFFDLCRARGLTGTQGVLVPASNRRHLMLRDDVVEAVRAGQFHVWSLERVDEALELLTGQAAGEPDAKGEFPKGSVHYAVAERLAHFAEILRESGNNKKKPAKKKKNKGKREPAG